MKFLPILLLPILLSGCMTTSSNIREVEVFPMGDDKYSLFVRGNNFVTNNDVKRRWYDEVKNVCKGDYTIEEVGIKKITMNGYLKPAIEGTFKCK